MKEKVCVLGINIDPITKNQLKETLNDYFKAEKRKVLSVAKVNAEILLAGLRSKEYKNVLNDMGMNFSDGHGVLWAAKYLSIPLTNKPVLRILSAFFQMIYTGLSLIFYPKYCLDPLPEVFPGFESMNLMLKIASENGAPVYFFGAEEEVLKKAVEEIKKMYPNPKVAGIRNGYDFKNEDVIKDINNSGAKMLFVALGHIKQEFWMRDNLDKLDNVNVAVGEGGTFDFFAGSFKRAPKWMRNSGLEWFWRLFMNKNKTIGAGSRAKRVWNAVPVFIYEVVKYKINNKNV